MLTIQTSQNIHLSLDVAQTIAERLTNPNSEFQKEMYDVVAYHNGRFRAHSLPHLPMAVIYRTDAHTGELQVIGWGASRMWRGSQTYETFIAPEHRRRGLSTAALIALVNDGWMDIGREVAVFSPAVESLVRKQGFTIVKRFLRNDVGTWVPHTGELVESRIVVISSASNEEQKPVESSV